MCKHKFKQKAPKLPIRLNGEPGYKRHNYCLRCAKWVVVEDNDG